MIARYDVRGWRQTCWDARPGDGIGEGEAFHRTSPDGDRGEKASLHSPAWITMKREPRWRERLAIVANHAIRVR